MISPCGLLQAITMQSMRIVLPGGLPGPAVAADLLSHLPDMAPRLVRWLERGKANYLLADPVLTRCTPLESWQLHQRGYQPQTNMPQAAGLGPLLAAEGIQDDNPVWLVELVHMAPAREGAMLRPARKLGITDNESQSLFETATELFEDSDFTLEWLSATHWRVRLPHDYAPRCASPELVSLGNVTDWWSQDIHGRAWRRLANELQMAWFDHGVNQTRHKQGLSTINGVWLFGGARSTELNRAKTASEEIIDDRLMASWRTADWGSWLMSLQAIDAELLTSFDDQRQPELILTGHDGVIQLQPHQPWWRRLLPGSKDQWKQWWCNPQ